MYARAKRDRVNNANARGEIRSGFDRAAGRYDREVGANAAMRYMRRASLDALDATFHPGQRVLEVGCGTGEEAVHLARRGVHVLATDLSHEMVDLATRRAAQANVQDRVQTRCLAASELAAVVEECGPASFDGAYSSFGPLNGEPDLSAVAAPLAALLRSGGMLAVGVMNRFYPLETLWYLAHGHPRQAVRRWAGRAMAGVSPALPDLVPTWYYTPWGFARAFEPAFKRIHCRALPLLLPPPPLAHLWSRAPGLLRRLTLCEERLASHRPFCGLGDHFLMILRRTGRDPSRARRRRPPRPSQKE
jgi:ubiquinone/menaquinone biosynthesis C-methylase UbiE